MCTPTLAIIVPVLDEAPHLGSHLEAAVGIADELIVCDGGSQDGSREIARQAGAKVIDGPRGRGPQLNLGASKAESEILLFLHADTDLPPGAATKVRTAIAGGAIGGAFLVRFDDAKWIYRVGERVVNLRTHLTRCPLGDQAQFVRREVFEEIGGYQDWPILEDLDFMRRLKRRGRLAWIDSPVTTAARRYSKRGVTRTLLTNWLIWILYLMGVSPHRLARLYRDVR
jgi:rSAM/selenodomain-associated transferase 2